MLDILEDPSRIYNADESGFQTCPESGKVLGPVGMKNFYEVKSGKEKEQLTVMVGINAAGQVVAPMIVYPLVRISKDISINVPADWAIGKSRKGWMTGALYYEYIVNIFDPWLKNNNIQKPVLLLVDGHRSHVTLQVSEYCAANQIVVFALYPNSTHITQPADVSVFKSLKSGWKNTVFEYKQKTGNKAITRAGFAPLLAKVFEDKVTPEIVKNGFERCGLYPFNPSAVDYTKVMGHSDRRVVPKPTGAEDKPGVEMVLLLESCMRHGRAEQFRKCKNASSDWDGDDTAKELYYVWKKFRQHCLQDNSEESALILQSPSILETPGLSGSCRNVQTPPVASRESTVSPTIFQTPPMASRETTVSSTIFQTPPDPKTPENLPNHQDTTQKDRIVPYANEKMVQIMTQKQKLISPAFSNCLLWPSDTPIKKKTKERIPLAVTSAQFREYHTKKEKVPLLLHQLRTYSFLFLLKCLKYLL